MWKLNPGDRLDHWKRFRQEIGAMPFEAALSAVQNFWNRAPFTPYYLDYHETHNWPDPWQLVYENYYCDLAKALGIVYTLQLSEHAKDISLEIRVCQDPKTKGQYNLVWIDSGKYVLNFSSEGIVNRTQVPQQLKLLACLTSEDLKLHTY